MIDELNAVDDSTSSTVDDRDVGTTVLAAAAADGHRPRSNITVQQRHRHQWSDMSASSSAAVTTGSSSSSSRQWRTYFGECGALGKHVIDVESNEALVLLTMSRHGGSPTQRGFLLHYQGKD